MNNTDTNPEQAAYEAAEQCKNMSPKKIEATVWKRLATNALGEDEAEEAFKDVIEGAMEDLSANTATTVGISSGVFDSGTSTSDDLSSGVME